MKLVIILTVSLFRNGSWRRGCKPSMIIFNRHLFGYLNHLFVPGSPLGSRSRESSLIRILLVQVIADDDALPDSGVSVFNHRHLAADRVLDDEPVRFVL